MNESSPGHVMKPGPAQGGGLTSSQVVALRAVHGPNILPVAPTIPVWRRFTAQLVHFFALMLWGAAILAVVGGLPELGVAIAVVVVVNAVFAFAQEYRAEQAAVHLRKLLPDTVMVVRDGHLRQTSAADLVPGDAVVLSAGDRVSADLEVTESHGLQVETSLVTGESEPQAAEAQARLLAGAFVVEGEGRAIVRATGPHTRLAEIALLTQRATRPMTPLTRELHRLVRTIALIAVGAGAAFFLLALLLDTPVNDGFIFAVGVTVALVPEGLLPTVTLSLALGAQRMADQQALVRRLEAVETLGSTTLICTDKTGTLTQNRMSVVQVWTTSGVVDIVGLGYRPDAHVHASSPEAAQAAADVAVIARRCSNGRAVLDGDEWTAHGDPMEAAIDAFARRVGVDIDAAQIGDPDRVRYSFDPRRRRSSVVTGATVLVKGAPDSVLSRCRGDVSAAAHALEELTAEGRRVLAVASRRVGSVAPESADDAERDLELAGLIALEDPPRAEAAAAVRDCRRAGIRLMMLTGDHPATAAAIAREVGLWQVGAPIVTGDELPEDDAELGALLDRDGVVVARVAPEEKLRIARVMRGRGHVVAMTGDGVNDGPALREADIGIAMGRSGTDVARDAADLVLLDDNFATIVAAVRQGRATFANARRFLTYHLTDNVAEMTPFVVWAATGSQIPLALGVLQILALDIGTDTLSAAALGADPPVDDVLDRPPVRGPLLTRTVAVRAFGVLGPTEAIAEMAAFGACLLAAGWRPGETVVPSVLAAASGAAFVTVVIAQAANTFACRSTSQPAWRIPVASNPFLVGAVLVSILVGAVFIAVPPVADLLDHAVPTVLGWTIALASAPLLIVVDAVWKARRHTPDA